MVIAKKNTFFNFRKGIVIICIASLFLAGCGSEEAIDDSGLVLQSGIGYEMKIPASWEVVPTAEVTAPIHGKLELAVRSLVNNRGFMNNLIVLSDTIQTPTTASEYVKNSMLWAAREYLSLTVVNEEVITFEDGQTSRLEIFHAKYNDVTQERLFFQTARICGSKVYLMTLGLENDTDPDNYARYKTLLSSFTCK